MRHRIVAAVVAVFALSVLGAVPAQSTPATTKASAQNTAVAPAVVSVAIPAWVPAKCRTAVGKHNKVICVGIKSWQLVALQNHRVVMTMSARHGAEAGHRASDGTGPWPTRRGTFKIFAKYTSKVSTLYHVKMPYFMPFSGGQGIHYSSEYAAGYRWSHGCVGLKSLAKARQLYNWAEVGTTVIVVNA
jgi:lipoprotein-anchoring transpeptidase ErfK/SrfK